MFIYYIARGGSSIVLDDGTSTNIDGAIIEVNSEGKYAGVFRTYNGPDEHMRWHVNRSPAVYYSNVRFVNIEPGSKVIKRWHVKYEEEE